MKFSKIPLVKIIRDPEIENAVKKFEDKKEVS